MGHKMYMVTLVTENRRALLGEIVGRSNAPKNSADAPHINLTPLGERVRDNFLSIQNRYEEVKVIALQMMPDHLHGILFVTTQMQQHLGQVISGFKSGCNKDYRELILRISKQTVRGLFANRQISFCKLPIGQLMYDLCRNHVGFM